MISRCVAIILTALVLAGVHTATVSAAVRDPIGSGLWDGASFNLSSIGGKRTATTSSTSKPAPKANPTAYAALGDSVAAGSGLPYISGATSTDKRCGRSSAAYPNQVAAATGKTLVFAACSGARAGDLVTRQGIRAPMAPQLRKAFANGTPGLITITAGANDIHWKTYLQKCYASKCATRTDNLITDAYLKTLEYKLRYILYEINYRSGGQPPKVILTGYYNPVSTACSITEPRFTLAELQWLNGRFGAINKVIQSVSAQYSFATYVPIDFTGHDVCSADPWVQGLKDTAPIHPTTKGQQIISRQILNAL